MGVYTLNYLFTLRFLPPFTVCLFDLLPARSLTPVIPLASGSAPVRENRRDAAQASGVMVSWCPPDGFSICIWLCGASQFVQSDGTTCCTVHATLNACMQRLNRCCFACLNFTVWTRLNCVFNCISVCSHFIRLCVLTNVQADNPQHLVSSANIVV